MLLSRAGFQPFVVVSFATVMAAHTATSPTSTTSGLYRRAMLPSSSGRTNDATGTTL